MVDQPILAANGFAGHFLLTSHAHVLIDIGRHPDSPQHERVRRTGLSSSQVGRAIRGLKRQGLVSETPVGPARHYEVQREFRFGLGAATLGGLLRLVEG